MINCGLCEKEIPPGTAHGSSMLDGKYIDVCTECKVVNRSVDSPVTESTNLQAVKDKKKKTHSQNLRDNESTSKTVMCAGAGGSGHQPQDVDLMVSVKPFNIAGEFEKNIPISEVTIEGQDNERRIMSVDEGQVEKSTIQILVEHRSRSHGGNIYYIKSDGVTIMLCQKEAEKLARAMGIKP